MTEAEWVTATDPKPMLEFLQGKVSDRKLRLLGCAFFRHLYAPSDPLNSILAVGEKFADGTANGEELKAARSLARGKERYQTLPIHVVVSEDIFSGMMYEVLSRGRARMHALRIQDIFGNPFRPVAVDSAWRTSTVLALARQIYDSRDFSPMPILADALQDTGCEHDDILSHCRGAGLHVRGCWVIDLLLGKE